MGGEGQREGAGAMPPSGGDHETVPDDGSQSLCEPDAHTTRLQLLFDNMLEGYAYCRMLFGPGGEPDDFVYLEVNRAFSTLTGLSNVIGERVTEVIPGIKADNPEIFEIYGRVVGTGVPERFDAEFEQLGIVLSISVFRPEPHHFVAVFEDITERKRAERKLEDLIRFLEYRVEERTNDLAEALRLVERSPRSGTADSG